MDSARVAQANRPESRDGSGESEPRCCSTIPAILNQSGRSSHLCTVWLQFAPFPFWRFSELLGNTRSDPEQKRTGQQQVAPEIQSVAQQQALPRLVLQHSLSERNGARGHEQTVCPARSTVMARLTESKQTRRGERGRSQRDQTTFHRIGLKERINDKSEPVPSPESGLPGAQHPNGKAAVEDDVAQHPDSERGLRRKLQQIHMRKVAQRRIYRRKITQENAPQRLSRKIVELGGCLAHTAHRNVPVV